MVQIAPTSAQGGHSDDAMMLAMVASLKEVFRHRAYSVAQQQAELAGDGEGLIASRWRAIAALLRD